jgi:hypothetical protein
VHHISVATIATDDQSTNDKKFGAKKSRRMLLETATAIGPPGTLSQKMNAKSLTVAASAKHSNTGSGTPSSSSGSPPGSSSDMGSGNIVERNVKGPKNMQAVTYPVVLVGVPVVVIAVAAFISSTVMNNMKVQKEYQSNGGASYANDPSGAMFGAPKNWNGDMNTPLIHRSRRD